MRRANNAQSFSSGKIPGEPGFCACQWAIFPASFSAGKCAVSSVVEHYLDTVNAPERNAPQIDAFSRGFPLPANTPPNKVPNTRRFQRVARYLQRHILTGELWFVARRGSKVVWQRLRTPDLQVARATVAMIEAQPNGNAEMYLVEDGKEQPLANVAPVVPDKPLPRVRQVLVAADDPKGKGQTPSVSAPASGQIPTLDDLLNRWRRSKAGLKSGTETKLDAHLKMLRRYVMTQRPVTQYTAQDIREFVAKAREDKDKSGRRLLKGQTINEVIWRLLHDAFDLAVEENFIHRNPMDSVKREKTEPIKRTQHKWSDAERVLEEVKKRAHESYLELKFMLFMGIGQAEAKDFTGGAVDGQEDQLTFIRRKTGKQYHIPVYPWAKDFIHSEMQSRLKPGKAVFEWCNPRKALETACRKLELPRVDIRSLRRTLIIHLLQQKVDIRLIAKWQGHKDAHLILSRYGNYIDAGYEKEALAILSATGRK